MNRAKFSVSPLFQDRLKQDLIRLFGYEEKAEQNCRYRLDFATSSGWARAKQFTNGTFYVEATDANAFEKIVAVVESVTGQGSVVEPKKSSKPASSGVSDNGLKRGEIQIEGAYVGTDESGKGDYFGPLVIAGVYVTSQTAEILKALGVMDSKLLKDAQIKALSIQIQQTVGAGGYEIIEIGPGKYNDLYEKFKSGGRNLNHMLAWGHAKVLENLLEKNPDCTQAIADQFGNERYILSQLQTRGKGITLHQTHKAEANVGVAAASVLARARFVYKVKPLSEKFGIDFPFGASELVKTRARQFVQAHGKPALREVAKLHFKTTDAL